MQGSTLASTTMGTGSLKLTSSGVKSLAPTKLDVIDENDYLHVEDANEKELETDRETLSAIRRSGIPTPDSVVDLDRLDTDDFPVLF